MFRRNSDALIDVVVLVRRGQAQLTAQLQSAGASVLSSGSMDRHFELVDVQMCESGLAALASIPGVYSVQPVPTDGGTCSEMSAQVNHDNVYREGAMLQGCLAYLDALGLDGDGVVLACVGNKTRSDLPDLVNRMLPCVGPSCGNGNQTDGHGTPVAGIVVADGNSGTVNGSDLLALTL